MRLIEMKINKTPYIGSGILVIIALIVMAAKPFFPDLGDTAHMMLGGILITLSIWIFKPFNLSYSAGGLFLAFFALASGLRAATVFSGFTQMATWTFIPALFFGYTLQKTGLGKRVALAIIRLFKPSYTSLVFAWVVIGVILSILTPAITVRIAIVMHIAVQCCEVCKLKKGSKGNSLILLTAFSMALLPGSGWLSGVLWGPIISGMINAVPGTENLVTFNSWLSVMFVPAMVTTVIVVAGSLLFFKPEEALSKDAVAAIKQHSPDKLNRSEIIAATILVVVFVMFLTNRFHGLPDAAICLAAVFVLFLSKVLEAGDMSTGVNWDLIVFFAMALSIGAIFSETGVSQWLSGFVVPALEPIAGNPWVFMFAIMLIMFVWRFVDIAFFIPTIAIMVPMLPAIQEAYNINPLIWVAIFFMTANCFFMAYQNMWAMMGKTIAGERAWESKHLGVYGLLYFIACMLALTVSVPMWISAGFFG